MRVIRVHVPDALAPGVRVAIGGAAAAHLRRVLRLGPGDAVTLFNGDGSDYPSTIRALRGDAIEAEVAAIAAARAESPVLITLVQGIARAERMDFVVQKATELGVAAIQPVVTARSVVRLDAPSRERKTAHWRGIAIAACEQCGRARVPDIPQPVAFADWLARPALRGVRLMLEAEAGTALTAAAIQESVELLVGPEGGLEDGERSAAGRAGFQSCRLGPRILRSETAAIAALAVLQALVGDLREDVVERDMNNSLLPIDK